MAEPQVIISRRVRVDLPGGQEAGPALREGGIEVVLDEGRRVRLSPDDAKSEAYAQILAGLAELRRPVYLEVDPDSDTISLMRVPTVGRVHSVRDTRDGLEFGLDASHARFFLKRDDERFDDISKLLRESERSRQPLIIVTDDSNRLKDAVLFRPGPDDGPVPDFPLPRPEPFRHWLFRWLRWPIWPWNWWYRGCVSHGRAQEMFDAMSATSCAPLTVPPPCIPFLYPDDGCWARAHEMCRLMINLGRSPRKVWIQGSLQTPTRNNPSCFVYWGWHVAPTLCVRRWWPWPFGTRTMVIDPSLFTTPVTVNQWKSVQGDPGATLTYTPASDYLWGQTDPTYSETNYYLAFYRLELQTRAVNVGPPPYANCP